MTLLGASQIAQLRLNDGDFVVVVAEITAPLELR
jgi:hypothetical protein